jgi:3'-phosphoadenosine 5'-phosphosulfate (PAPS) 3'-phosphatase
MGTCRLLKARHKREAVTVAVAKRLRTATEADSAINAIIVLDIYTKAIPVVIEESLEELRYLRALFFEEAEKGPCNKPSG